MEGGEMKDNKIKEMLESVVNQMYGYCQAKFVPKELVNVTEKDKKVINEIVTQAHDQIIELWKEKEKELKELRGKLSEISNILARKEPLQNTAKNMEG